MRLNVVELHPKPSREALEKKVHELALDTANIDFEQPHFRERLSQRSHTMRQVLDVLRFGEAIAGPTLDKYGDWRIKLRRFVAGRRVQVVVAVQAARLVVITTI